MDGQTDGWEAGGQTRVEGRTNGWTGRWEDGRMNRQMDRQMGGWMGELVLPMGSGRAVPKSLISQHLQRKWVIPKCCLCAIFSLIEKSQEPLWIGAGWLKEYVKGKRDNILPPLSTRPTTSLVHHTCFSKSITKICVIIVLPLHVSDILIHIYGLLTLCTT